MIDTGALRKEIINLAVQGKLVSQKSDEGDTEDIYDLLRKKGKKTFADILEENMSFSIPNSWRWGTLSDLTFDNELNDGNWVLKEDMVEFGPVKLIQLGNIGDCKYIEKGYKYLTEEHFLELNGRQIYPGYLLINRLVVKDMYSCIIPDVKGILMTAVDVCWVAPNIEHYNIEYIMYALSSNDFRNKVQSLGHGVTRFRISKTNLINIAFPIPPISEQNRIVKKIKELFKLLDRIDALQTQYSSDLEVLKSKIIDAGIQGKLTEQLPEDGTAEELLAQIAKEKKQLIKEKKIKETKALPEITEDEMPFEIPDNWKWVRLSEIMDVRDGTHDSPKYVEDGIPLVTSKNISSGGLDFTNVNYISQDDANKINERSNVDTGDILFAMIGTIGNPVIVEKDREFCIKNVALFKNFAKDKLDIRYVYWMLMREQYVMKKKAIGGLQPFISLKVFREYPVPLPPIAEQRRIADKLDDVISMC